MQPRTLDRIRFVTAASTVAIAVLLATALAVAWYRLTPPAYVEPIAIETSCSTSAFEATCMLTNSVQLPVATCLRLRLTRTGQPEKSITTINACSGRIEPRESKTIHIPWGVKKPTDVCSQVDGTLFWPMCDLTVESAFK
jgi:hypothetical protein